MVDINIEDSVPEYMIEKVQYEGEPTERNVGNRGWTMQNQRRGWHGAGENDVE